MSKEAVDSSRDHETRYRALLSVSIAMVVVSSTITLLRLYTRTFILRFVGLDDWTIVLAQFAAIAVTVLTCIEAYYGLGQHVWMVSRERQVVHLKYLYCVVLVYNAGMNVVKISFLLLYRRIFSMEKIANVCKFGMMFVAVWTVIQALILSFSCIPLSIIIPRWSNRCLDTLPVWYASTIIATILDFFIFAIPLPGVITLKVKLRQKLMIVGMFCLGFFVCIVSVIRVLTLRRAAETADPTWDNVGAAYWSVVELNCSILASSLPTLRPLLARSLPKLALLSAHQTHHELREQPYSIRQNRTSKAKSSRSSTLHREHVRKGLGVLAVPPESVQPEWENFDLDLTQGRHQIDTACFSTNHTSNTDSTVAITNKRLEMAITTGTVITIAKEYV